MALLGVTKPTKWPSHTASGQSEAEIFLTRRKSFGVCLATVTRSTDRVSTHAGKQTPNSRFLISFSIQTKPGLV